MNTYAIDPSLNADPLNLGPVTSDPALAIPPPSSAAQDRESAERKLLSLLRLRLLQLHLPAPVDVVLQGGRFLVQGTVASDFQKRLVLQTIAAVAPRNRLEFRLQIGSLRRVGRNPLTREALRTGALLGAALVVLLAAGGWLAAYAANRIVLLPAETVVLLEGQPAAGATLALHPIGTQEPQAITARGIVGEDGRVQWTTLRPGDGVPSGDYIVTATWRRLVRDQDGESRPGANLLTDDLARPDTSPLRLAVHSSRSQAIRLELKL